MRIGCIFVLSLWVFSVAEAAPKTHKSLCVFDVAGNLGEVFATMKDYQLEALKAGINFQMQAYQDENKAVDAFKVGICDLVAVSDIAARDFNSFTGSISAIGAVPAYGDLKILMKALASPRIAKKLEDKYYQILGVIPLGGVYLFVNDRELNTVQRLAGKRFSVLEHHLDASYMVKYINGVPVPARITTFGTLFNSGEVDVSYAPAAAYQYLELYKGIGRKGGIIRYPLGQFTLQLVARKGDFDPEFVNQSRRIMADLYETAMEITRRHEAAIPESAWIDIPKISIEGYQEMLRGVRVQINSGDVRDTALANVYNADMLRLLRKIRCHTNLGLDECNSTDRE